MSERAYGTKNEEKMQELASDFSEHPCTAGSFAIETGKNRRKESKNQYSLAARRPRKTTGPGQR